MVMFAITITALWVNSALAAKEVITEVNPSGITPVNQSNNSIGDNPTENAINQAAGNTENAGKDAFGDHSRNVGSTQCFEIGRN